MKCVLSSPSGKAFGRFPLPGNVFLPLFLLNGSAAGCRVLGWQLLSAWEEGITMPALPPAPAAAGRAVFLSVFSVSGICHSGVMCSPGVYLRLRYFILLRTHRLESRMSFITSEYSLLITDSNIALFLFFVSFLLRTSTWSILYFLILTSKSLKYEREVLSGAFWENASELFYSSVFAPVVYILLSAFVYSPVSFSFQWLSLEFFSNLVFFSYVIFLISFMLFNHLKHSFLVFNRSFCYPKFLGRRIILCLPFHRYAGNFGLQVNF